MEQVIISKKLFFTIVGFSFIILVMHFLFYTFRKPSNRLHVCVDSDVVTVIRESPENRFEVYSANTTKNILWCLGKYVPFFERKLNSLHVKNQTIHDDIARRYSISTTPSYFDQSDDWMISNDHIVASFENGHIFVYYRPIQSPYRVLKEIDENVPTWLISPENNPEVRTLLEMNTIVRELRNGEHMSLDLSRGFREEN